MNKTLINKAAKSNLAKLLATENITVEHRKVKTAFFDLQKRLLVVPIWKEMNVDILDLLLAHEIGHALFTPQKEWKEAIDEGIKHSFLNVIEDARIEKLIKRKYPGLSQSFIKGYRDLIANDFFKTKDRDLNEMLLIDRLNMHFKSSHVESTIEFTSEEEKIVKRMASLETFEEVKILAKELMEYCDQEAETKNLDEHNYDYLDGDDGDPLDLDSEDSENEEGEGGNESKDSEEEGEEEGNSEGGDSEEEEKEEEEKSKSGGLPKPGSSGSQSDTVTDNSGTSPEDVQKSDVQAETDSAWNENQTHLLDEKCKDNAYMNVHEFKNLKEFVVDYKKVLKDFRVSKKEGFESSYHIRAYTSLIADYKKFQRQQSKAVNYMVKEFELKKAANAYSRSKQDKSGVVDPLKLHSYKFNDDIFKRLTITPDGKNHGLMMFIDWSGSMSDKITATIHQLMNLTMFCRKVSIPFEVYSFSNNTSYPNAIDKEDGRPIRVFPKCVYQNGDISIDNHLILFNLISSKMTAKEYDEGMTNLYFMSIKYERGYYYRNHRSWDNDSSTDWKYELHDIPTGYNMSSTPLNDTIMAAMKMVPAFQSKYNIHKMNTVFLTDGSSDSNGRVIELDPEEMKKIDTDPDSHWSRRKPDGNYRFKNVDYDQNRILSDRVTKKQISLEGSRNSLTECLLKVLRLRTGTKVLGFYVAERKRVDRYTLDRYFPESNYWDKNAKTYDRKKIMAEFRKNKVLVVKDNTGYDELYLLAADNMKVEDGQMATPSENAKKGEIKRLFTANLKGNKASRVVLNKFISQVA